MVRDVSCLWRRCARQAIVEHGQRECCPGGLHVAHHAMRVFKVSGAARAEDSQAFARAGHDT
eukprot:11175211-Lingulodinium_polyedra.AAC.1